MRKLTLPLLVTAMIIALLGIIFVQYLWIDKSITEKQNLIDQKVHQAIANIDQQLSDHNTMAFMSLDHKGDELFNLADSNCTTNRVMRFVNKEEGDTTSFANNITFRVTSELDAGMEKLDSGLHHLESELNIISDAESFDKEMIDITDFADLEKLSTIKDSKNVKVFLMEKVSNLFDRVSVELEDLFGSSRMDSTTIAELLGQEFKTMGLESPKAWSVYDTEKDKEIIAPSQQMEWDFELPLNKNDILHPNRYQIRLNIDKNEMLWSDIRLMIIMSLLFLLVMFTVFITAIRLVIKHKKISQIKSDFINNMTHEFKTPLASISLAADSIVHPGVNGNQEQVKKYVDIIKAEKSKLNDQVERILEVASLDKDSLEIPTTIVSLNSTVKTSIQKLELLLEESRAEFTLKENADLSISGNEFYLERVLINIIENSIKYAKEKPVINISIEKKDGLAIVEIKDQGIGMSKDQIAKVFDNFYRVQSGNLHDTKGFGLGLSYSKLITEKIGGKIKMDGKLNEGCTVTLTFPIIA